MFGGSAAFGDLNTGLVLHLSFDGNLDDETGNGHNGIGHDVVLIADRLGNSNSACFFNGSSGYIEIPASSELDNSNVTLCAWINWQGGGGVAGAGTVIDRLWLGRNDSSQEDVITLAVYPNMLSIYYQPTNCGAQGFDDTFTLELGRWYFWCVTIEGTNIVSYLNGQPRAAFAATCDLSQYSQPAEWLIGAQIDYGELWSPWQGAIDEVRIYNRALSRAEIAEVYREPSLNIAVSQIRLCWSSRTNLTYQVQYRSELTTNEWVNLGSPVPGNGGTQCVTDEVVSAQRFYRVILVP